MQVDVQVNAQENGKTRVVSGGYLMSEREKGRQGACGDNAPEISSKQRALARLVALVIIRQPAVGFAHRAELLLGVGAVADELTAWLSEELRGEGRFTSDAVQ